MSKFSMLGAGAVLVVLALSCAGAAAAQSASAYTVFVAPDGNDAWDGSTAAHGAGIHGPVQSLERARDLVHLFRAMHSNLTQPVVVQLTPGTYRRLTPLTLQASDSGTTRSPTIFQGSGKAMISGGVLLPDTGWVSPGDDADCPICARHSEIRRYQLPPAVLAAVGQLKPYGFSNPIQPTRAALIFAGQHVPLARWPDTGYATVKAAPAGSNGLAFVADVQGLPSGIGREADVWASGYWHYNWADFAGHIRSIDPDTGAVSFEQQVSYYGISAGDRYFFFNALSALDAPGEWYLNQRSGKLYFWPPQALASNVELALAEHLVLADGVSNVTFKGVAFSASRGDAVVAKGVDGFVLDSSSVTAIGGWGVTIAGRNSGVSNSELHDLDLGGIKLTGGDRQSLVPAGLYARNNIINHYAQRVHTVQAGIEMSGVGAQVSGNTITDAPHVAIMFSGNDHVIERNHIMRVVQETSDSGAIYIGRDWTGRGTVIRGNYLADIRPLQASWDVKGVYLDDQSSGITVVGNVFWGVQKPLFIGGGSDNVATDNIFIDSAPGIYLDIRGLDWEKAETQNPKGQLQQRLAAVPFDSSPVWRKKYPALINIKEDGFGVPRRNRFQNNHFVAGDPYRVNIPPDIKQYQVMDDAVELPAPAGVDLRQAPDFHGMCKALPGMGLHADMCN